MTRVKTFAILADMADLGSMQSKQYSLQLTGRTALMALAVLGGVVVLRIMAMRDMTKNEKLMTELKNELMTEYFPHIDKLEKELKSGSEERVHEAAKSLTTLEIKIDSVSGIMPLFDFSNQAREVALKVKYTVKDAGGKRKETTKYYLYEHAPFFNTWNRHGDIDAFRYYLSFMDLL